MPRGIPKINPKEKSEWLIASGRRTRASYTEENALRFKPIFDCCIRDENEKGKRLNRWLNPASLNLTLATYHNRISEALRWLMDFDLPNSLYKKLDYIQFRNKVNFKKRVSPSDQETWGVMIEYRKVGYILNPETDMIVVSDADKEQSGNLGAELYKQKIDEFFNDTGTKFLDLKGIEQIGKVLNATDIAWIKETFESVDIAYEVGSTFIKAIKD